MGDILETFPEHHRGRPAKYPWADWLDGRVHRLKQGEDFEIKPISFRALVHRTAKSDRFRGKVETTVDGRTVVIRFFRED